MDLKLSTDDLSRIITDTQDLDGCYVTEAVLVYCYEKMEGGAGYGVIPMSPMPDHHVVGLLAHSIDVFREDGE